MAVFAGGGRFIDDYRQSVSHWSQAGFGGQRRLTCYAPGPKKYTENQNASLVCKAFSCIADGRFDPDAQRLAIVANA